MKRVILSVFILLNYSFINAQAVDTSLIKIDSFVSIYPNEQTELFQLPSSHRYQVLLQDGEVHGNYIVPGAFDFTGYLATNGITEGIIGLNHEANPGGFTTIAVRKNDVTNLWKVDSVNKVDVSNVGITASNCSGTVTPWNTIISGEETFGNTDSDLDGYMDLGWLTEYDPISRKTIRKIYAAGMGAHENCVINQSQTALYTSNDHFSYAFMFKYVFTTPGVDSTGTLYALKLTNSTGAWIQIPNTTITERNTAFLLAANAGATNFGGVEDIELDSTGAVYFATKYSGNVYRFEDNGSTVSNFDTFVISKNYVINTNQGAIVANWGGGVDNLAFDKQGNLWAYQDGGKNYIWVVEKNHHKSNPKIKIFGISPIGSEPTGITFSPDGKYIFMSFQHPAPSNTTNQLDASNTNYIWNKNTTIVISEKSNLGSSSPLAITMQLQLVDNVKDSKNFTCNVFGMPTSVNTINEMQVSKDGKKFFTIQTLDNNNLSSIKISKDYASYFARVTSTSNNVEDVSNTIALPSVTSGELAIYPNPNVSNGIASLKSYVPVTEVQIFSLQGALVFSKEIQNNQSFALPTLVPGQYVIKTITDGTIIKGARLLSITQ